MSHTEEYTPRRLFTTHSRFIIIARFITVVVIAEHITAEDITDLYIAVSMAGDMIVASTAAGTHTAGDGN